MVNWVSYHYIWYRRKQKIMLNNRKCKIYFQKHKKRLLRKIRAHHKTSEIMQISQNIFRKTWPLIHWWPNPAMQRILLPCNDQKPTVNRTLQYPLCQRRPAYLVVLVGVLLVWDSRIQKANNSLLSIRKNQWTNQLANIFHKCFQMSCSLKFTAKLQNYNFNSLNLQSRCM